MWVNDFDFVDVTSGVARHLKVKRVLPTIKKMVPQAWVSIWWPKFFGGRKKDNGMCERPGAMPVEVSCFKALFVSTTLHMS